MLREFAAAHGAAALPALTALASDRADRTLRRTAKRSLYRLAQRGIATPRPAAARPVVERAPERARGRGSRASTAAARAPSGSLFEGGFGGAAALLAHRQRRRRASSRSPAATITQEAPRARAGRPARLAEAPVGRDRPGPRRGRSSREALALHAALGDVAARRVRSLAAALRGGRSGGPPPARPPRRASPIRRSRPLGRAARSAGSGGMVPRSRGSPERRRRAAPGAREPARRLRPDQGRAGGRRSSTRVVERELTPEARARWARRLAEMALIFAATDRAEQAAVGRAPPPRRCATRRARVATIRSCARWPGAGSSGAARWPWAG